MISYNNCNVQILFIGKSISVNDTQYYFDFSIPDYIPENPNMILWSVPSNIFAFYDRSMNKTELECTQENFDHWVKPFVEQWQEKYNEAHADEIYFPNRQAKALTQLNEDFAIVSERAHIVSSLGFTADANRIAKDNVQGLIEEVGEGTIQFCDYHNQFHELNKTQLETLKSEINQNGQNLYQQKWVYRTQIEGATDNDGLDAVVAAISFSYMDFTPPAEEPTGDGEQAAETDQSAEQTE